MFENHSLINGIMVNYNGKIMMVADTTHIESNDKVGLVDEVTFKKNSSFSDDYDKVEYHNVDKVGRISAVKSDLDSIKSFFRLEADIWKLTKEKKYPFAPNSKPYEFSLEDLETFVKKLKKTRKDLIYPWIGYFIVMSLAKPRKTLEVSFFTFDILWALIKRELNVLKKDFFVKSSIKVIEEMIQAYKDNREKKLNEFNLSDFIKGCLLEIIEKKSQHEKLNNKEKEAYIKFIEDSGETNQIFLLKNIADAYYWGNAIIEADWKKAEKVLVKIYKQYKAPFVVSRLANIYSSNELGEPDYKKAFKYLEKVSNSDDTEVDYMLSDLYRKGLGTRKNTKKAFELISSAYDSEILLIAFEGTFEGKYPEVALRMGIFYENGLGRKVDYHTAMEFYLKAKHYLEMRSLRQSFHNDEYLMTEIDASINRVADKNDDNNFDFSDVPGYPGAAYQGLAKRDITKLQKIVDKIFSSDIRTLQEKSLLTSFEKKIDYLYDKFEDEAIYQTSFEWLKKNADDYSKVSFFISVFDDYFSELVLANPYPLLAFLYIKFIENKVEADKEILTELTVSLLRNAGIMSFDIMKTYSLDTDKNLINEVQRQKELINN